MRWDGKWYEQVTTRGYPNPLPVDSLGQVAMNPAAFFPLFPQLAGLFTSFGVPFWLAGSMISLACSTAAAGLIFLVMRQYCSSEPSLMVSCLWSAFPTASVLSVPYTEALFTMLAAATLLFGLRHQWTLAAVFGFLAAYSRPTGVIVIGALGIFAVTHLVQKRDWRPALATAFAASGLLAALAVIGNASGRWDAWFVTEREGWRLSFDGGLSLVGWMVDSIVNYQSPFRIVFVTGIVGAVALGVLAITRRPPVLISAYLVLGLLLAIGQGGHQYLAQLRYVLPLFPMLEPVGSWVSTWPVGLRVGLLAILTAVSGTIGAWYFTVGPSSP